MEMDEVTFTQTGEVEPEEGNKIEEEEHEAFISINSILGNVENGRGTMRVRGTVGQ